MKTHSTDYKNTFIRVEEDTKAVQSKIPNAKASGKSIAEWQYELLSKKPYELTSDELLFKIHCERNDITLDQVADQKTVFFSRGQACLRTSPLAKTHGFGIHFNQEGKIALVPMDNEAYDEFANDKSITQLVAMRSCKK